MLCVGHGRGGKKLSGKSCTSIENRGSYGFQDFGGSSEIAAVVCNRQCLKGRRRRSPPRHDMFDDVRSPILVEPRVVWGFVEWLSMQSLPTRAPLTPLRKAALYISAERSRR